MLYLSFNKYPETKKARYFYCFNSIIESSIISFLTIFISQCAIELKWTSLYLATSLALMPLVSFVFIMLTSYLASHHAKIIKLLRYLYLINFIFILVLGLFIIFYKIDINNQLSINTFFSLIIILTSLIIGIHSSILSLQSSSIAYINFKEKTGYGHVCLYGALVSVIVSPISGLIASSISNNYLGYGYLFLIFAPFLLSLIYMTFKFDPYHEYIDEIEDEKVTFTKLIKNKHYMKYFILAVVLIAFSSLSMSISSTLFDEFEIRSEESKVMFSTFTWGILLGVEALVEFIFIFINTKFGISKKIENSTRVALIVLLFRIVILNILSYYVSSLKDISLLLIMIFANSMHGISLGLYLTSNMRILNKIHNSKYRTKAIFFQNGSVQLVSCFFSFIYPFMTDDKLYGVEDFLLFTLIVSLAICISINFEAEDKKSIERL